jgi:YD repeat-containing protein
MISLAHLCLRRRPVRRVLLNGNVTNQKTYPDPVTLPATAGGTPPAGSGAPSETQFIYDRNNRLTETRIIGVRIGSFNGSTYVTTVATNLISINQYDAAGNVIREQDANGSSIYHYYDKNGREIGKVDQENYLTVYDRDAEGNVLRDRRVSNKIPVVATVTSDPNALLNPYNGGVSLAGHEAVFVSTLLLAALMIAVSEHLTPMTVCLQC